jgi:hypothetical protein
VRDDASYIPTSTNAVPTLDHFCQVQVGHSPKAPKVLARLPFFIERQVKRFEQSRGFFGGVSAEHSAVDFDGDHLYLH